MTVLPPHPENIVCTTAAGLYLDHSISNHSYKYVNLYSFISSNIGEMGWDVMNICNEIL